VSLFPLLLYIVKKYVPAKYRFYLKYVDGEIEHIVHLFVNYNFVVKDRG